MNEIIKVDLRIEMEEVNGKNIFYAWFAEGYDAGEASGKTIKEAIVNAAKNINERQMTWEDLYCEE